MKKSFSIMVPIFLILLTQSVYADKGPIIWNEGVELSQESQKAIILHNSTEEILILGTEMKAKQETEILEFIPFPSEPQVMLASGNPFEEIKQLITKKGLRFEYPESSVRSKGGESEVKTAPVVLLFSEKIGLHDVTTIKINDIEQFSQWLEIFLKNKGISAQKEKFQSVFDNARDYLQRGYCYFVFDSVKLTSDLKFLEPLVYQFRTDKIYFPLKTTNLIGGIGAVEMIFILPGSISDELWQITGNIFSRGEAVELRLSSSAKVYPDEVKRISGSDNFFGRSKIYLQVLKYKGKYQFKDDFTYQVNKLDPFPYRFRDENPFFGQSVRFIPNLTEDERRDLREVYCLRSQSPNDFLTSLNSIQLDCFNFIPNDEYEVYSALFKDHDLSGIPKRDVTLENITVRKEYKGKNVDKSIVADIVQSFNENNKIEYPLENGFAPSNEIKINKRNDKEGSSLSSNFSTGKTFISRAGFNKMRTEAMIYVSHISGPRSGVGYFVTLKKNKNDWEITGSQLGVIF